MTNRIVTPMLRLTSYIIGFILALIALPLDACMLSSISIGAVTPANPSVCVGSTRSFSATVSGGSTNVVNWYVDGIMGGSASVGTISNSGVYSPPTTLTSRTNLCTDSEDLTQSRTWSLSGISTVATGFASPDGRMNLCHVVESTANDLHYLGNSSGLQPPAGGKLAVTMWIPKNQTRLVVFQFTGSSSEWASGSNPFVYFNPATGAFINASGWTSTTAVDNKSGFWFITLITANAVASPDTTSFLVMSASAVGTLSYPGDGSSWISIWGVTVSTGSTPIAYIPTGGSPVSTRNEVHIIGAASAEDAAKFASTGVTVVPSNFPSITNFTASPATVAPGAPVTLNWVTTNAASLSISGIGPVTGTSRVVSPTTTTTYTLTATNTYGNVTASTTATVLPPSISVGAITPSNPIVNLGTNKPLSATASGGTTNMINWLVDGIVGGNATVGTISNLGVYTPPSALAIHTNLCTDSEDLTQSRTWSPSGISSVAAGFPSPDGSGSLCHVMESTANNLHYLANSGIQPASGAKLVTTMWVPKNQTRLMVFQFTGTSSVWASGSNPFVYFNPATGAFSNASGWITTTAADNKSGFWFITLVTANAVASPAQTSFLVMSASAVGSLSYAGNGTSWVSVWGVMISVGTVPNAYIPTEASPVTTTNEVHIIGATSADDPTKYTSTGVRVVPSNLPSITTFTATPATVTPGEAVTLSWTTTNATSFSISGIGAVSGTSWVVNPTATNTYTLIATNAFGSATASVPVTVTSYPTILSFTATPVKVAPGDSVTLSWSTTGATSLSISGIGPVTGNSLVVNPTEAITYTLTASNSMGGANAVTNVLMKVWVPKWSRNIIYIGSREVAEMNSQGLHVTLVDHLGTPRSLINAQGQIEAEQKFLPFGETLGPQVTASKFAKGFTNHEQTDPSGLIYMQARFYAPWYGRFLSPDPARDQHFEDTQSWNIYSYVRNQPTMFGDPTGMEKPMSEQERRQQEEAQKATNTQGFHAGERQAANQIASAVSKVMPKGVTVSGQAGGETGVGLGGASTNVQVGKVYFSGTPDSPLMKTAGYVSGTLDVGVAGANIASGARAANGESQGPFKSSEAAANGATVIGGQRSAGISFGLTNAGNREEFSGLSTQYSAGGNFGLKLGSMSFSINDAGIYHFQIGPPVLGVGAGASASKTFTYTAVSREVPTLGPGMPL